MKENKIIECKILVQNSRAMDVRTKFIIGFICVMIQTASRKQWNLVKPKWY